MTLGLGARFQQGGPLPILNVGSNELEISKLSNKFMKLVEKLASKY